MTDWMSRHAASVMNTYGPPQRVLVRGKGAQVWDADGAEYLDLLAGVAVNVLGHSHPAVVAAVTQQVQTLGQISNFFTSPVLIELAERVLSITDAPAGSAVFFANSGAEANEAAFKLARRTGRSVVVAAEGGFHGRTLGALSLTGKSAIRDPFAPLLDSVVHVPWSDAEALRAVVTEQVAAVVLEPIQGEAGVQMPSPGYLRAAREACDASGALLIFDEVQTGVGRTGTWMAHRHPRLGDAALTPDAVTLAKGLGGGLPISALVAYGASSQLLGPGQHGSTFGGNPISAAAALATLRTIESQGLLARAAELGAYLTRAITNLGHPLIAQVRGQGLLLAIELQQPAELQSPIAIATRDALAAAGFLVNAVTDTALRLAPPFVVTADQLDRLVMALPAALATAQRSAAHV